MKKLMRFFKDEDGVTAVEYAVMVALIAAVSDRRGNNSRNRIKDKLAKVGY